MHKIPPTTQYFLSTLMEEKIHQNINDEFINYKSSFLSKFKTQNTLKEVASYNVSYDTFKKMADRGEPIDMYVPPEHLKRYEEEKKKEKTGGFGKSGEGKPPEWPKTVDDVRSTPGWEVPVKAFKTVKDALDPSTAKSPKNIMLGDTDVSGTLAIPGLYIGGELADVLGKTLGPMVANRVASSIPGVGGLLGAKLGKLTQKAGEALSDISGASYVDANVDDISFQNLRNVVGGAGSPFYKIQIPVRQTDRYGYDYWRRQSLAQNPN